MKTIMSSKTIGKGISAMMLVLASLTVTPSKAQSTEVNPVVSGDVKPELQVRFLGANGDFLYFELSMQQADDLRSNLRIRNESGGELYSETVFRKASIRKLKIAKDEAEKIEFVYNTTRGEVRKVVEIKIKVQEAIEVKDVTRL